MLRIAVTGGVACGKSLLVERLEHFFPKGQMARFDCDAAVRGLLEETEVQNVLINLSRESGVSITSETGFEKGLLRKVLFENSAFREKVEGELHPRVLSHAEKFAQELDERIRVLIIEVPLLYEVEFPIQRDMVLVVAASAGSQMRRLLEDRQLPEDLAANILKSQMSVDAKMKRADVVVWNEGSLDSFDAQIEHLANRCISLFN
ncbi:MAG: dephospho-CoA kinase [Verrucomicrobiales bacterium]|nr:dephospho-CoA kinase [Verrucomicrobiales bacterium]